MSEKTNISYTDHTASPYLGCTEVSPGCVNCYSRELTCTKLARVIREAYRKAGLPNWDTRPIWGDEAPRALSKGFWRDVYKWNKQAKQAYDNWASVPASVDPSPRPQSPRIFPSLIDWLDEMPAGIIDQDGHRLDPVEVLARFLKVIYETPNLTWLLLTKRPQNWRSRLMAVCDWIGNGQAIDPWWGVLKLITEWLNGNPPANIWFGVTVEDQARWDERYKLAMDIPAAVHWFSFEPLLERINTGLVCDKNCGEYQDAECPSSAGVCVMRRLPNWAVVGLESGSKRRDPGVEVLTNLIDQLRDAKIPVYCKQDCAQKPGQQGRIPNEYWTRKEMPNV